MSGSATPAVTSTIVQRGDVQIEVLAQGSGRRIVLLPSLGRGAPTSMSIAEQLAGAGYRVLRPQPRGIGASRSPSLTRTCTIAPPTSPR